VRLTRRLVSMVIVAALPAPFGLALVPPQGRSSSKDEPFRSFRQLDGKLTELSNYHDALKQALRSDQESSHRPATSKEATATLVHMASATTAIERITARLERVYQDRREPFGARVFRVMHGRAQAVQSGIDSMRRARTQTKKTTAEKELDQQLVSLIVQYQAVSGGYATTHCVARSRTCCQPKRSQDLLPGERVACKWTCLMRPGSCKGFLGPRIP